MVDFALTGLLILSGGGVLFLSILETRHVLQLVEKQPTRKTWQVLRWLMVFFLCGYLGVLGLLLVGYQSLLLALTGAIFFFGALFVYLVVKSSLVTMRQLLAARNDTLDQDVLHRRTRYRLGPERFVADVDRAERFGRHDECASGRERLAVGVFGVPRRVGHDAGEEHREDLGVEAALGLFATHDRLRLLHGERAAVRPVGTQGVEHVGDLD
ncbi:MAG: hypothetical protein F6K04_23660, partial [Leptolyngbya sp. SIO4C5]|nr:hypothetical protein [Leptolyngbya sp. SIO4C5]